MGAPVIEHGANVNLQDKNGLLPLHYAASHSDVLLEISKNLIEIGADENKCAEKSKAACWWWHVSIVA